MAAVVKNDLDHNIIGMCGVDLRNERGLDLIAARLLAAEHLDRQPRADREISDLSPLVSLVRIRATQNRVTAWNDGDQQKRSSDSSDTHKAAGPGIFKSFYMSCKQP